MNKENQELTVYITTCDANIFVIKYFQYFFNKYWDKNIKVKILGFSKPTFQLSENFEFISMGETQVNGAKGWSNYLIDFFSSIDEEHFVFGIDDFMIARPVDTDVFEAAKKILTQKVGRIDLQPMQYARSPSLFKFHNEIDGIKFFELKQRHIFKRLYRVSGAFSIWNKEWFLSSLKRDMSPWDWEVSGSRLVEGDGYHVLCSWDRWAIKKMELLSNNAWPGIVNIKCIREEDVYEMNKMIDQSDRVSRFEVVDDERFYYKQYAGSDWEQKVFGE